MKALKLGLIFAVLVAGIILILNMDSDSEIDTDGFIKENKVDIVKECEKISKEWAAVSKWDKDLYKKQIGKINQQKAAQLYSKEGYEKVCNLLREEAINKAYKAYIAELTGENFYHSRLMDAYAGMKSLVECVNADFDMHIEKTDVSRVVKVYGINDLYLKVNSFKNQKHTITASFNTSTKTWRSFKDQQNSVLNTARNYRNNKYYADIRHLPGFAEALDETKLKNITNGQKDRYHRSLCDQIIQYFESLSPFTEDDLSDFNKVYDRFVEQSPENGKKLGLSLNRMRKML